MYIIYTYTTYRTYKPHEVPNIHYTTGVNTYTGAHRLKMMSRPLVSTTSSFLREYRFLFMKNLFC